MFTNVAFRVSRLVASLGVAAVSVTLVGLLTFLGQAIPNVITIHTLTFYGVTAGAYAILPFIRRGDVLVAAIWLVLAAGVAPCFAGQEITAPHMFADLAGVLMAAGPIYIARHRQLAQGDLRDSKRRRQAEREIPGWRPIEPEPADSMTETAG